MSEGYMNPPNAAAAVPPVMTTFTSVIPMKARMRLRVIGGEQFGNEGVRDLQSILMLGLSSFRRKVYPFDPRRVEERRRGLREIAQYDRPADVGLLPLRDEVLAEDAGQRTCPARARLDIEKDCHMIPVRPQRAAPVWWSINLTNERKLHDEGGTRSTTLAQRAGVTKQAMSQQVKQMERDGYLEQVPDLSDTRAEVVRMTPWGESVKAACAEVREELNQAVVQRVGKGKARELEAHLDAAAKVFADIAAGP